MKAHEVVSFQQAEGIVLNAAWRLPTESVGLHEALGRVLAVDVTSDVDMPPFRKAAMDGYACRRIDLADALDVVEDIPAGHWPERALGPGQCARIMTGAPVPDGADCVVMVEETEIVGGGKVRFRGSQAPAHICAQGEDVRAGDRVLCAGEMLGPAHIAMLASVGRERIEVSCRPRVAIVSTGNELVEPGTVPAAAQIRNSNAYQLCSQAVRAGATAAYLGIVRDDEPSLTRALEAALGHHDLVVVSGGVSAGAYDLVPAVLRRLGVEVLFERVAMQPGRPTLFGRRQDVLCSGLPGNPVSTFVVFELLLRPLLCRMMGHVFQPLVIPAVVDEDVRRNKSVRQVALPVRFTSPGRVMPVGYHGPAHIHAMARADGLVLLAPGVERLGCGETVHVRSL